MYIAGSLATVALVVVSRGFSGSCCSDSRCWSFYTPATHTHIHKHKQTHKHKHTHKHTHTHTKNSLPRKLSVPDHVPPSRCTNLSHFFSVTYIRAHLECIPIQNMKTCTHTRAHNHFPRSFVPPLYFQLSNCINLSRSIPVPYICAQKGPCIPINCISHISHK